MDRMEIMWIIVLTLTICTYTDGSTIEYCAEDTYEATCNSGEAILMTAATVGRMWIGRCVDTDRGHLGCSGDALLHMDSQCSGRQSCKVNVVNVGKKQSTCPTDLMSFLVAQYKCVPVVNCIKQECVMSDYLKPSTKSGYLSGTMASQSDCGTNKCPWMIQAAQGQQINFTLFDFNLVAEQEVGCLTFGMLYDGHETKVIDNCNQRRGREVHIYTSNTNSVRVELYKMSLQKYSYMIKYNVYGCADMATPKNAETQRSGESVTVKCLHSKSIWHLTCNGNRWIGEVGSCPDSKVNTAESKDQDSTSSSLGMLFVIGLGVALGIAVGFILLCIVAAYMKRKHKNQAQKNSPLLHGNPQYRDYLSKTGTMFGLYPTGQMINDVGDHTLIYRPVHDYTSTLHPHQHPHLQQQQRPLPHIHEVITHPRHVDYQPSTDDGWDSSVYNQSIGTSAHGGGGGGGGGPGSVISGKGSESDATSQQQQHPQQQREHIYELPSFPDRNRAHSADSGLVYSLSPYNDQTNHRTT